MKNWIYIFLLCPFLGFTQDIQFSQWYNNPLYLNPANAGQFDGDYRITADQREQWASVSIPFSSTSVAFDMPYKSWGFGAQLLRDQSGSSNLSLTQLSFSIARFVESWGFGLHLGFAQQKIDYSELYFLDAGEQIPSLSKGFMDIGLGVNNTLYISDSELKLAYSLAHLNKPDRSFYSNKDLLAVKHQLSTVLQKPLTTQWSVEPFFYYALQSKQAQCVLGSNLSFDISEYYYQEIKLEAGSFYRIGDAVGLLLGVNWQNSHLAFTYDWNVSDLVPASNSLGAWELSFRHIIKSSMPRPSYKTCPTYL